MHSTGKSWFRLLPQAPQHRRPALLAALFLAAAGCSSSPAANPVVDAGSGGKPGSGGASGTGGAPGSGGAATDVPSSTDMGGPDTGPTPETNPGDTGPDVPLQKINILAIGQLTENGQAEIHAPFVMAAKPWLAQFAAETNMTVTNIENANVLTDAMLADVNLILQLNHKPHVWSATAKAAFEKYLSTGKGGWVGLHHAGLYGGTFSQERWPFYGSLLGGIMYQNYIASFVAATVKTENPTHPVLKGVPAMFNVAKEEWYKWDKTPRPNVTVLAAVDESTYMPPSTINMGGDHPVVWTNDKIMGKNLYIFMGHDLNLFQNAAYVTLLKNAIMWAGTPR